MAAVETALAVSQRIGGGLHIAQIIVGPFVKIPDHLQIVVQHLIKISALGTGFCQNHRKMLTAPILKRPTNTGSSLSSAGCMPPRSYQGLKKARQPMGLMTFLYLLYMLEI